MEDQNSNLSQFLPKAGPFSEHTGSLTIGLGQVKVDLGLTLLICNKAVSARLSQKGKNVSNGWGDGRGGGSTLQLLTKVSM